jgi:hypothetical protein
MTAGPPLLCPYGVVRTGTGAIKFASAVEPPLRRAPVLDRHTAEVGEELIALSRA